MRELLIAPRLDFQAAVLISSVYIGYWLWPGQFAIWRSYPVGLELVKYPDQAARKRRISAAELTLQKCPPSRGRLAHRTSVR